MDAFDRHNVVHLSSNFRLQRRLRQDRYYEPNPLDVELLALSLARRLVGFARRRGRPATRTCRSRSGGTARRSAATTTSASSTAASSIPFGPPRLGDEDHRAPVPRRRSPATPLTCASECSSSCGSRMRTYRHTGLVYDGPIAEQLGEQYRPHAALPGRAHPRRWSPRCSIRRRRTTIEGKAAGLLLAATSAGSRSSSTLSPPTPTATTPTSRCR